MDSVFRRIRVLENHGLGNVGAVPATARLAIEVLSNHIPGSFMECGVAAGVHPAAMAMVLEEWYRQPGQCSNQPPEYARAVYLCDSFDGIPKPGPKDGAYQELLGPPGDGELVSTGISRATLEQVQSNMMLWGVSADRLRYVVGWFQNTLKPLSEAMWRRGERLAMLRIDANLYESVKACMETMAPLLSPGGVLILDDYRVGAGKEAIDDWFAKRGAKPRLAPVDPGDPDAAFYAVVDWE
jgi:hypothetical protein